MTTFLQAVNAMQVTHDKFKNDSVGSMIDSMHKMTQQADSFASTLHGFTQPPPSSSYQSSHGSPYHQQQHQEPWMDAMPQVPRHTPKFEVPASTQPAKPKPPISVYIPTGGNLEARFQNLKK